MHKVLSMHMSKGPEISHETLKRYLKSDKGSLKFITELLQFSISYIMLLRGILPESDFVEQKIFGVILMKLRRPCPGNEKVSALDEWLKGSYDALIKKYLRKLALGIYTDKKNPHDVIETYTFLFTYYKNGRTSMTMNGTNVSTAVPNSEEGLKEMIESLFKTCKCLVENLKPLPKICYMRVKLLYYTNTTPSKYEPPGFTPTGKGSFCIKDGALSGKIGAVSTYFHTLNLARKGFVLDEFPEQPTSVAREGVHHRTKESSSHFKNKTTDIQTPHVSSISQLDTIVSATIEGQMPISSTPLESRSQRPRERSRFKPSDSLDPIPQEKAFPREQHGTSTQIADAPGIEPNASEANNSPHQDSPPDMRNLSHNTSKLSICEEHQHIPIFPPASDESPTIIPETPEEELQRSSTQANPSFNTRQSGINDLDQDKPKSSPSSRCPQQTINHVGNAMPTRNPLKRSSPPNIPSKHSSITDQQDILLEQFPYKIFKARKSVAIVPPSTQLPKQSTLQVINGSPSDTPIRQSPTSSQIASIPLRLMKKRSRRIPKTPPTSPSVRPSERSQQYQLSIALPSGSPSNQKEESYQIEVVNLSSTPQIVMQSSLDHGFELLSQQPLEVTSPQKLRDLSHGTSQMTTVVSLLPNNSSSQPVASSPKNSSSSLDNSSSKIVRGDNHGEKRDHDNEQVSLNASVHFNFAQEIVKPRRKASRPNQPIFI